MFCTSLRRRKSFASIVAALNNPPLSLKESQLDTHDVEILLSSSIKSEGGNPHSKRRLRVLLISPAGVCEARLETTLQRIQHFAALTGGEDLAVLFLLNPSLDTGSASTKNLTTGLSDIETSVKGVYALSQLQAHMVNHPEILHIPVLPLSKLDGITHLLQKHMFHLTSPMPTPKPWSTSFDLLRQCTAGLPMSTNTTHVLSDLFPSLKELATACSSVLSTPTSSSVPVSDAGASGQTIFDNGVDLNMSTQDSSSTANRKFQILRDLVGDQESQGIIDFWKDEWTID